MFNFIIKNFSLIIRLLFNLLLNFYNTYILFLLNMQYNDINNNSYKINNTIEIYFTLLFIFALLYFFNYIGGFKSIIERTNEYYELYNI